MQLLLPGFEEIPSGGGRLVKRFADVFPRVKGTFSSYYPGRGREVLWDTHVAIGPAPEGWGWSPAGVARRIVFDRRGRWPDKWVEEKILQMPMPSYAIPGAWDGEWVLVDIQRAFETILKRWGVRLVSPLRYFSAIPAWVMPEVFWCGPGEKWVLRVLPAVARGGWRRLELSESKMIRVPLPPLDSRPWGTVATVLWGIAWRAWTLGAVYWNTDGGILPVSAEREFAEWLGELGLSLHYRARGEVEVRGIGAYRVGGLVTGHFDRIQRPRCYLPDLELGPWASKVLDSTGVL